MSYFMWILTTCRMLRATEVNLEIIERLGGISSGEERRGQYGMSDIRNFPLEFCRAELRFLF